MSCFASHRAINEQDQRRVNTDKKAIHSTEAGSLRAVNRAEPKSVFIRVNPWFNSLFSRPFVGTGRFCSTVLTLENVGYSRVSLREKTDGRDRRCWRDGLRMARDHL